MYKYILFASLIVSIPFQYECELKDTKIKLQAIITPIDMVYRDEINYSNRMPTRTDRIQKRSNIKTKRIYITVWLKKNTQVKLFHKFFNNYKSTVWRKLCGEIWLWLII